MFERERVRKRPIISSPETRDLAPASVPLGTDTAAAPHGNVGFDFGSISILPPALQVGAAGGALPPATSERIRARQGAGAPLEPAVQRRMEPAFGHSFADVRVHADGEADTLNRSLGANAFTRGSDIFLGEAAGSAGPHGGDRLLAHELAHVVQQRGAAPGGALSVGPADDPLEREAGRVADTAEMAGMRGAASVSGVTPGATIQRDVATSSPPRDTPTLQELFANYNAAQRPQNVDYPDAQGQGGTGSPSPGVPTADQIGAGDALSKDMAARDATQRNDLMTMTTLAGAQQAESAAALVAGWDVQMENAPVLSSFGVMDDDPQAAGASHSLSIGDRLVVKARLKGPIMPGTVYGTIDVAPLNETLPDNLKVVQEGWTEDNAYAWTLVPVFGGHFKARFGLGDALSAAYEPLPQDRHEVTIAAHADGEWFLKGLGLAKTTLDGFYEAAAAWLPPIWTNYKAAYETFTGGLEAQEASDRRAAEILVAVLFAATAGVVGGMVGSAVEHALEPEMKGVGMMLGDAYEKASTTGIATAWEDITKLIVTLPQASVGGGGPVPGAAPATGAGIDPGQAGAKGQGANARPVDPLSWYVAITGKIAGEKGQSDAGLAKAQRAAMEQMVLEPGKTYDWDPVAVAAAAAQFAGKPLTPPPPVPEQKEYERGLWGTWLAQYAYILVSHGDDGSYWNSDPDPEYAPELQVGKKLRKAIDAAAKKWGQTADDWIAEYGGISKAVEDRRARGFEEAWENLPESERVGLKKELWMEEKNLGWK